MNQIPPSPTGPTGSPGHTPDGRAGLRARLRGRNGFLLSLAMAALAVVWMALVAPALALELRRFFGDAAHWIANALSLKYAERHRWWADAQLAVDALTISAFVSITGGVTSYFSSLYTLPIGSTYIQIGRIDE